MLKVEHLTKVYPNGTVALKDVSFEVNDGEFLIVIGLSGSGKSTLLRCINRLIDPTEGKIAMDGIDVTAPRGQNCAISDGKIGMIFQQFNLVKRSSVMTNVLNGRLGLFEPMDLHPGNLPAREEETRAAALDTSWNSRQSQQQGGCAFRWTAATRGYRPNADAGTYPDPRR